MGNIDSLDYYKNDDSGYVIINEYLRSGKVTDALYHIANIDKQITQTSPGLVLYRGFKPFFTGNTFVNLGYSSCTTNMDVALRFSGPEKYVLQFILPPDILFYKYDDEKTWLPEDEYLLQRGLEFNVFKIKQNIFHCRIKLI